MGAICCSYESPVTIKYHENKIESPPMLREYSSDSPFSSTGMSTKNPLELIQGYEDEPIVPLEAALKPLYEKFPHLRADVKEAKTKCYHPAKPKLKLEQSAAIYIYTMKSNDGCLYDHLQAAWKSGDPSELKPWLKYLKLFKSAFDKLPDANEEIWQGKSFDDRLEGEIKSNSSSLYMAMDIFSPSKSYVEEFLHNRGIKEKILIGFKSVGGKLVGDYAASNWNGVIVFPGTKLGLSDIDIISESGSVIYHMTGPIRKYHYS
jgi:hypothetical protein